MATAKSYYRVVKILLMKGKRKKLLVLERIDKPIFPDD